MPKARSAITRVPNAMRAAAAQLVERAAMSHVSVSQQLAPVKTGFLRDHIRAERVSDLTWNVLSEADYSAYVEFEQPFFLPGYESAQRQLRQESQQLIAFELARLSLGAV